MKMAAGVVGTIFMSFLAVGSIPIAVFGSFTLRSSVLVKDFGGGGIVAYMWFMGLFQMAWILAATEYDSRMPYDNRNSMYVYIGLLVVLMFDLYLIKKKLHKWGSKLTSKELKVEYKALKREKKQRKLQAI